MSTSDRTPRSASRHRVSRSHRVPARAVGRPRFRAAAGSRSWAGRISPGPGRSPADRCAGRSCTADRGTGAGKAGCIDLLQASGDSHVAAPAAGEPAVPVVRLGGSVQADPHPDIQFAEQAQVGVVQADRIGLHPGVHLDAGAGRLPGRAHQVSDDLAPGQQWLPAVQDQVDAPQPVGTGVLADSDGGLLRDLGRHPARLIAPRLVGHFVHVAVVTR